ncbi:MAG: rod shape-determining protein RodA [Thermobacillus sp.]|uniref:Bacterial cell division membrane protein n=1 Tax=Thermobacillus composti (strain DSM 18247 / JCM 13945 / KWC4) TaxID=717605 RepID=L0EED0_THECK|nr:MULTISPECIES: FtsW/RodA/SpoVE family cell cycle protein [Thermobacillus]AGA58643.1 bacterial cell division membrane protein [Thermobacillus composti KWC4]REK53016.1 MAG: rod shape-determining protein RodA [Thermobacillus sp.]
MLNKLKRIDFGIMLILGLLMVISVLVVRSATYGNPMYPNYDLKQLIFFLAGFAVAVFATLFDYRFFLKYWYVLYGFGVLLLVLVYFFGVEINGARSWFKLADGLLFQPAEFMKILLIMTVASILARRDGDPLSFKSDLLPVAAISLLPFALVMIQPDLGNAIIYIVILLGMLWIGRVKYWHVLTGIALMVVSLILFVAMFNTYNEEIEQFLSDKGKHHWYERINTFINPETASDDAKHQSEKSLIAIGSGGLTGDGYMKGDMKNRRFIPYPYSDSIFVVIGEEFGFQGAALLLLLYFLLIYRMIMIAFQCTDLKGSYIIVGIVSMFVFQIFQNIGMMIGLMPITGITLPFISYGGTSLLINMVCIGLVFSIRAHQQDPEQAT